jgi:hypothetical protein
MSEDNKESNYDIINIISPTRTNPGGRTEHEVLRHFLLQLVRNTELFPTHWGPARAGGDPWTTAGTTLEQP